MGHNRLGRLKSTYRWREVVGLLDASPNNAAEVAAATATAADARLASLSKDPSLNYCFWLLTRITRAARGDSFISELSGLGISASPADSAFSLVARAADRVSAELASYPSSGHFKQIASMAFRTALTETVLSEGQSLFGTAAEDTRRAFREFSTQARFGALARRFFSAFMSRTLRSLVDRELSNHVGPGRQVSSLDGSRNFLSALDTHSWETAAIVEEYAGGWYSRHNWESQGQISIEEVQRFVSNGLRKLRSELKQRQGAQGA